MPRLAPVEIRAALADLPGWVVEGEALRKVYQFKTFRQAMAFVNQVAGLATEARHHPEICINYNRVTLTLTTHDEGGLTEKDIALAQRIEQSREA